MTMTDPRSSDHDSRRRWMGILARAATADLETAWAALDPAPSWQPLRPPECGLVMVRGRAGGTGAAFNMGEMTVTRCSVRLADGTVGHGYVAGRDRRHAELAALFDAVFQTADGAVLLERVATPLGAAAAAAADRVSRAAAATKVEFLGLVRSR